MLHRLKNWLSSDPYGHRRIPHLEGPVDRELSPRPQLLPLGPDAGVDHMLLCNELAVPSGLFHSSEPYCGTAMLMIGVEVG